MAKYNYKAKRGVSEVIEGTLEADTQDGALAILTGQGLFPVLVEEVKPKEQAQVQLQKKKSARRINSTELLNFIQKLNTLIRAKVELLSSLRILYEQTENSRMQEVILALYENIKQGKTFSESLEKFPIYFTSLFINIVRAGEASGRLDLSLEQAVEYISREEALKTKVKIALAYPVLLLFVGLISIIVLMNFVIPKLAPMFSSLGEDMPLVTRVVLWISDFSKKSWWLLLAVFSVIAAFSYFKRGAAFYSGIVRNVKLKVPLVKRLTKNQELANFSRSLGLLLKSGVPALRAIEIASLSITEKNLKEGLANTCRGVASGQSISRCLKDSTSLPGFFVKMIAVGEESGRLAEVLDEITRSYSQQIEADIALISSIIEPVLILGLGLILGTIVLALLLPIFQITQMVH